MTLFDLLPPAPAEPPKSNLTYHQRYYLAHRDTIKAQASAWQRDNPGAKSVIGARYHRKNPQKGAARRAVFAAVANGTLVRQACEVCGREDSQGHHDDYARQLDVRWLCPPHHAQADAARRKREAAARTKQRRCKDCGPANQPSASSAREVA